jgi:hypothetical protein
MTILRSQINPNTTLPAIREYKGSVNCVLAIRSDTQYDKTNTYMPKWDVVNTVYYNAHKDKFDGWIELEDAFPPDELL